MGIGSENKTWVDWLNVGLIVLSLLVAYILPFRLFLFSYAVLGPLHYLTEINWLQDRRYFLKKNSKWVFALVLLCLLLTVYPVLNYFSPESDWSLKFLSLAKKTGFLLLWAFLFATALLFMTQKTKLWMALLGSFVIAFGLDQIIPKEMILWGVFLPTIFHVYLFTLLFVFYGAKKDKSRPAYLTAILLLLVPFVIAGFEIDTSQYVVSKETANTFRESGMIGVSGHLSEFLGLTSLRDFDLFSPAAFKIQVFIAFAYTYHYLNWFSKTSVIGWKKSLTGQKSKGIIGLWLLSMGIYYYDFQTGFIALFFLSFLHVLLEFPLNILSIKGLFSRL